MGLIKGGLLVIASVLIFVFFLIANSLLVVSNSLEYENIQEELTPVIAEIAEENINISDVVEERLPIIEQYCENNSEYVFSEKGETFEVSCESFDQGVGAVVNETVSDLVEEIYYEDYDCGFLDCFKENQLPYFLVSEQSKNYFENKFYWVLFASLILAVAMFFLIENKTNLPFLLGGLLIFSSLPFLKMDSLISFFADKSFLKIFTFLFTQSYSVAIKSLFAGIILIAVGLFLKFFKVGFWISDLFSKFKKNQNSPKISMKNSVQKNSVKNKQK